MSRDIKDLLVLGDLSDDELDSLTDKEVYSIGKYCEEHGLPYRSTVKGLLEEFDIESDDLSEFILGLDVGICNHAIRTDEHIIISRKDSRFRDNIKITLDEGKDVPIVVVQVQVDDDGFVHEEGYTKDGGLLYRA